MSTTKNSMKAFDQGNVDNAKSMLQAVQRFAYGGLVPPQPEWFLSSEDADTQKRMQDQAKAYEDQAAAYNAAQQKYKTEVYDPYISQIEAYNRAVEAFNAGPRTSPFGMSVPTQPAPFSMTAPTLPFTEEQAKQTTADIQKRADEQYLGRTAGLEVMLDPKKYNLGIRSIFDSPTRRFNQGGEATTDDFIKSNVSRGTSEVPEVDSKGNLIDEREEIRSESRRMLNRLQSQPSKLPPGLRRTVAATREQGKESMFPVAAPARDFLSGIIGASPTAPGSQAYRTGQALANMPPVQAAVAIPAKIAASTGDAATALAAMGPAMGTVIKPKGGNWVRNQPEKLLRRLKNQPDGLDEDIVMTQERLAALENTPFNVETQRRELRQELAGYKTEKSLNNWIDTKLGKYIKNEMGTPEDPLRKLAERGVLHIDPDPYYLHSTPTFKRRNEGFPEEGFAQSDLAKRWENIADEEIDIEKQKYFIQHAEELDLPTMKRFIANNPWVKDLDPETSLYSMSVGTDQDRPGFRHLIDELRNASNPQSGLPRELQIDPQKLDRVSVPQAVELVDKINKWRMDNIKNLQLEETLKADLYKVYPEKNYRWVQLNRPGQFAAESDAMGHSVRGYEPPDKGGSEYYGLGGFKAIQSGEAKVYSLRDEKGQPHVTIEVSTTPGAMSPSEFYHSDLATQSLFDRLDKVDEATINRDKSSWWEEVVRESPEYQEYLKTIPSKVTQIKGKGNEAPAKKYWAFAQDFVKSGNWSDVQDLRNIGLRKTSSVFNETDIAKLKAMGENVPNYVAADDIRRFQDLVIPEKMRLKYDDAGNVIGYKHGGPVNVSRGTSTSKQQLDKLAQVSQRKKA